ncbi:hypothetical protein OHB41_01375 [Streptomyces sp. NBC_01571]|uniref:hypothetical protein n=1 Tax=Streptomyces sp. NBC_01571 TaxID=2975883 RepID=UPI00225610C3|nr:hypothetical protein [Streptomyces sp. NBC_01571]MCX4571870.1 hypothetical protein [Streptomyces sp. NBC_01571]
MPRDASQQARDRLSVLAPAPGDDTTPARCVEQDASLVGRLLAAAGEQNDHGRDRGVGPDDVGAALGLFEDLREELDRLETQVVMEARRRGMDWRQIAAHQGLNSSQAASQRYQRLMTRLEEIRQGVR